MSVMSNKQYSDRNLRLGFCWWWCLSPISTKQQKKCNWCWHASLIELWQAFLKEIQALADNHSPQTRTKPFRFPLSLFIPHYFSFIDTARCQLGHNTETANCRWWLFVMFQAEPEAESVRKKTPTNTTEKQKFFWAFHLRFHVSV